MKNILLLFLTLLQISCGCSSWTRTVELGNNFGLVEGDDTQIHYDRKGGEECFYSSESAVVVPAEVVAYNYNDRWIIAKSQYHNPNKEYSFWIIDKDYNFSRLGYPDELKKQTIGPLDSIQFQKEILKHNIKLKLKSSKE